MTTFLRCARHAALPLERRCRGRLDLAPGANMIWSFVLCALMAAPAIAGPPRRVVSQTVGTDELLLALADPAQIAALSHPDRGEELVRSTQRRVAELARKLRGLRPVRVLAVSTYPFTAGSQTTFQDLCDHAGAVNVAAEAGLVGHASTPDEKLLTWNPQRLIASDTEGPDVAARLREMPAYRHLPALEAGRLVLLPGALMGSVTHHRVAAFEELARKLHPERFR